jgi:DNA-binding NarL/FixJ family response regulator
MPFEGSSPFDVVWAIKNQTPPALEDLRGDIPSSLANLVRRMLRKDNPARVDSVRQVGVELEKIQKELGVSVPGSVEAAPAPSAAPAHLPKIRVLIVDDHAVVRQGLRMFIDLQDDMEVVGEGTNGAEGIDLAGRLNPDIVLLDLVMPQMDGVAATIQIKAICPSARVIILTSFGEDDKVFPAIRAGAQGYLLKDIRPDELVHAVRDAFLGKTQLHPDIAQKLMSMVAGNSASNEKSNPAQNDPHEAGGR